MRRNPSRMPVIPEPREPKFPRVNENGRCIFCDGIMESYPAKPKHTYPSLACENRKFPGHRLMVANTKRLQELPATKKNRRKRDIQATVNNIEARLGLAVQD